MDAANQIKFNKYVFIYNLLEIILNLSNILITEKKV